MRPNIGQQLHFYIIVLRKNKIEKFEVLQLKIVKAIPKVILNSLRNPP
jgi:hypothetical protein